MRRRIRPVSSAAAGLAALALAALSASPARPAESDAAPAYAELCGDPAILGYAIEGFDDGGGCVVPEPVAVAEIAGVALSPVAVVRCPLARRLARWIEAEALSAAEDVIGSRLTEITHLSAYVCRRRNSRPNARLSLHGTGMAIDLAIFHFESGARVDVTSGWDGPAAGAAFLRRIWSSACGPFGTVLGPDSDAFHRDHFHVDIAPRERPYCR